MPRLERRDEHNPLERKLSSFSELTTAEKSKIAEWSAHPKQFGVGRTLIRPGGEPDVTCVILSGRACRFKITRDGRRQIVGIMLPGDMCDLHGFLLETTDHGIQMLSDATIALVPGERLYSSLAGEPGLMRAMWWSTLVEAAISREWLLNIGQRTAIRRVANLFCELWSRADRVGLVSDGALSMPITQQQIAEALGLTSVHVNRVLKVLRDEGLATIPILRQAVAAE
jgi:CRP-like cAMP-binding protein